MMITPKAPIEFHRTSSRSCTSQLKPVKAACRTKSTKLEPSSAVKTKVPCLIAQAKSPHKMQRSSSIVS